MNTAGGQASIVARYGEGPAQLEQALTGLQDADLDAPPAQGGWTIRQIVHHIGDGDDLWKVGMKAALGNEQGEFTLAWYWVLAQDVWADRWAYAGRPIDGSLALFKATRAHVTELLTHVPGAWNRSISVRKPSGETTRLTVGAIIEMQADHLQHHPQGTLLAPRSCCTRCAKTGTCGRKADRFPGGSWDPIPRAWMPPTRCGSSFGDTGCWRAGNEAHPSP
jgi:hypothetical protein